MEYWKGLNGSYDAANDLLIMFHDELNLTYENGVGLILCYRKNAGPTNLQRSENKINRFEQGEARRDDSREE